MTMSDTPETSPEFFETLLGDEQTLTIVRGHKINALNYHHRMLDLNIVARQKRFGENIVVTNTLPDEAFPHRVAGLEGHFRIIMKPRADREPINGIESITLRYPIMEGEPDPEAGDDNGVKDVFIELMRGSFIERYLLNGNGLQPYRDADDILEADDHQQLRGNLFCVQEPLPQPTAAQLEANNNLFAVVPPSIIKVDEQLTIIGELLSGSESYQYEEQSAD